jgi:hypothetical protein
MNREPRQTGLYAGFFVPACFTLYPYSAFRAPHAHPEKTQTLAHRVKRSEIKNALSRPVAQSNLWMDRRYLLTNAG